MQLSPEQQKQLDEQKAQCPFCKIAGGEYPSTTIYEDNYLRAVLDIRPAREGHVLVIPKEHYPILAFMPEQEFEHTFSVAKGIAKVFKKSLLSFGTNIFVANGGIAGQQVPHFAFHLIPRDKAEELSCFNVPSSQLGETEWKRAFDVISNNLKIAMKKRYDKFPLDQEIIESRVANPELVDAQVEEVAEEVPQTDDVQSALMLTDYELENLLNMKESLKTLLLEDNDTLHEMIASNSRLQKFFEGTSVEEVARRAQKIFSHKEGSLEELAQ